MRFSCAAGTLKSRSLILCCSQSEVELFSLMAVWNCRSSDPVSNKALSSPAVVRLTCRGHGSPFLWTGALHVRNMWPTLISCLTLCSQSLSWLCQYIHYNRTLLDLICSYFLYLIDNTVKYLSSLCSFFLGSNNKLLLKLSFINVPLCLDSLLMKPPFSDCLLSGHSWSSREGDDGCNQRAHPALSFPRWDQVLLHAALCWGQTPHWVGTNLRAQTGI